MIRLLNELKSHKLVYFILAFILIGATFVRIYNTGEILGFYYDQGRDALVIWNFIHNKDLFLVGPTTGIEGILRGPWYYWLILPFYFLGGGNPVWPANFLAITSVFAIVILFYIAKTVFNRETGLIAAVIASFSYYMVVASRWLSNPTPMLLISMLLVFSMLLVTKGKKYAWVFIAALLGLSMQFGSATETFFIPAVIFFSLWQRKNFPNTKILIASISVVVLIFLPQIVFDFLKDGILSQSIRRFLVEDQSFKLSFWEVFKLRFSFYWEMFSSKVWVGDIKYFIFFFVLSVSTILFHIKELWKKDGFRILLLLGASPLIGMIFFQGNKGNIYDYYFTGYYLIYILLFSVGLGYLVRNKLGLVIVLIFFYLFFKTQLPVIGDYLVKGRSNVNFKEQLQAIDWIYVNSDGQNFNVDVYVPPVIPYAYDYLFLWKAQSYGKSPVKENTKLIYTLYEEDIAKRLNPWLNEENKVGRVVDQVTFRGITVQKRLRYD